MKPLNFRQIHLDFHTSEKIPNIGKNFNKKQFQEMLQKGHVDSITLFSKCHHGWAYHPSKANSIHPNLNFDLLGAQIEAAHEIGVNTPVYISAGLDEKVARRHPEWLWRNKNEETQWAPNFTVPGYHMFCLNTDYVDILLSQIEEVVKNYDANGIFLDIVKPKACYCQNCVHDIIEKGENPYDEGVANAFADEVYASYTKRVRATIDAYKPGLPVFHNGGHIPKGRHDIAHMNTHLELESLPTGGWGYDHFPLSAKYVVNEGMEFLGMTGKFHTTWGEFGGFKHPNALLYETSLTLAMGGKCSIGDQLHPEGLMDPMTYDIIGFAYREVERKEPWCNQTKNIADIGVLSADAMSSGVMNHDDVFPMDIGANRMLLQEHYLYEIIGEDQDFDAYKVLILPDTIRLHDVLKNKLQAYLDKGGKILATGQSGMAVDKDEFAIDLGVTWICHNENMPNYYYPKENSGFAIPSAMIMYTDSEVVHSEDAMVHGYMQNSFFNREVSHFCSHQHTPSTLTNASPGMILTKNTAYIPWQIFTDYAELGSLHQRKMITYALDTLLDSDTTLSCNLPSQGIVSYMKQEDKNRNVLHLLYASPVLRGNSTETGLPVEVIEDLLPIYNTKVEVTVKKSVQRVYLAPQMLDIPYTLEGTKLTFTVDSFTCHQMVVIDYI